MMEWLIGIGVIVVLFDIKYNFIKPSWYKKPKGRKHNFDMEFIDEDNPMSWSFICKNCGNRVSDMKTAIDKTTHEECK